MSKYFTFLFLCLATIGCGKVEYKNRIGSGNYPSTIHYKQTWSSSQGSQGALVDTTYFSLFSVKESSAKVARVQFPGYNGAIINDELELVREGFDSLFFATPYGPDNRRSTLIYNDSTHIFVYTNYLRDNAASGGNQIVYTIQNH